MSGAGWFQDGRKGTFHGCDPEWSEPGDEIMGNAFLTGDRLDLRSLEAGDADLFAKWSNDEEVKRFFDTPHPSSRDRAEDSIRAMGKDRNVNLGIVIRESDRLIGWCRLWSFNYVDRNCLYAILIGEKECWGQGYGTEATRLMVGYAFRTLNMHKVSLYVNAPNKGAIRAYEKAGFVREGMKREDKFYDGVYHDTVTMSILEREWRNSL